MKSSKIQHDKDLEFKKFLLILKRDGQPDEVREFEAYGRDYARRWADCVQIQENCRVIVKIKK